MVLRARQSDNIKWCFLFQASNRRILFNLLPAHVATHFLDNQFRTNMVTTCFALLLYHVKCLITPVTLCRINTVVVKCSTYIRLFMLILFSYIDCKKVLKTRRISSAYQLKIFHCDIYSDISTLLTFDNTLSLVN